MNDFKNAVSEAQAQKALNEQNREQQVVEDQKRLEQWLASVRSWERETFSPLLREANEALKELKGHAQSTSTRQGNYQVRIQARGKGRTFVVDINREGILRKITNDGFSTEDIGNISSPKTAELLKATLLEAVRYVAG